MNQTSTNDEIAKLEDLKTRQLAGEHMHCPRCGRGTMDEPILHNALSRHADVYICSTCGMAEALLDAKQTAMPIDKWACITRSRIPERLPASELISRIMTEHIDYLTSLYTRWLDEHEYEDFGEYREAAMNRCPGLTELQPSPFIAVYKTKDGKVVVRFENDGDSTKVSAEIVE